MTLSAMLIPEWGRMLSHQPKDLYKNSTNLPYTCHGYFCLSCFKSIFLKLSAEKWKSKGFCCPPLRQLFPEYPLRGAIILLDQLSCSFLLIQTCSSSSSIRYMIIQPDIIHEFYQMTQQWYIRSYALHRISAHMPYTSAVMCTCRWYVMHNLFNWCAIISCVSLCYNIMCVSLS